MYKIIIVPDPEGGFDASVPALKGCMACEETPQKALECVLNVQQNWLEIAKERDWEIPELGVDK